MVLGRRKEMEDKMAERIIERFKFWLELRKWEIQKRKEGFPKEWFEDITNKDEQE